MHAHTSRSHRETAALRDPSGTLFMIGGALEESAEILDRLAAIAGSVASSTAGAAPRAPRIAILTTASEPARKALDHAPEVESDEADGIYYRELFARHGIEGVTVPVGVSVEPPFAGAAYVRAAADDAANAELVRSCDGVFFGGGDQTHYILALHRGDDAAVLTGTERDETLVLTAVRELLARGGVIAGTSAGLAVQQGPGMVTGGTSAAGWLRGAAPGYVDDEELRYLETGGLGFFTEGLADSHFNEWDRVVRAVRIARATGQRLVFGVDENTALIYDRASRTGEIIGTAGCSIIDVAETEWSEDSPERVALGARWSHLTRGDRYDFASETITRAAPGGAAADPALKTEAPKTEEAEPEEALAAASAGGEDVGPVLLRLAQRLVASSADVARMDYGAGPDFRVTLLRDERTSQTRAAGFSALRLSIATQPHHS